MKKINLIGLLLLVMTSAMHAASAPPSADRVFQLSANALNPNALLIKWTIKPGFFIYQKSLRVAFDDPTNDQHAPAELGSLSLPKSQQKLDAEGHRHQIYRNTLSLLVPILGKKSGESMLTVDYQGCSDSGFCYPPQRRQVLLSVDAHRALHRVTLEEESHEPPIAINAAIEPETTPFIQLFDQHNPLYVVLSFFSLGLLMAFTPCVLPMIPVLSGIIVGQRQALSTRTAFFLSLSYVISMSITYSLIGGVIAFMGHNLQMTFQSTWAILLFSLLFIALALSMFGVFEMRLPSAWQTRITRTAQRPNGHYIHAAIMGSLSILILSPCVTAPLIGALSYIAREGNISLGILSLFFLSIGMGTPLLLIGTSAGKYLPKAGAWMNEITRFFGVLMLSIAIYLLNRIMPGWFIMMACASLLIGYGVYVSPLKHAQTGIALHRQVIGLIAVLYGALIIIGASEGHQNPLFPLKETNVTHDKSNSSTNIRLTTLNDVKAALSNAASQHTPVVLDFYADWCASCKTIANTTLQDAQVLRALERVRLITVDLTPNNKETRALLHYFQVVAPPVFLFFNKQGQEQPHLRLIGECSIGEFLNSIAIV